MTAALKKNEKMLTTSSHFLKRFLLTFFIMVWPTDINDRAEAISSNGGVPPILLDEMETSGGKTEAEPVSSEEDTSHDSSGTYSEMESQDSGSENEFLKTADVVSVEQDHESEPEATETVVSVVAQPEENLVEQDHESEPDMKMKTVVSQAQLEENCIDVNEEAPTVSEKKLIEVEENGSHTQKEEAPIPPIDKDVDESGNYEDKARDEEGAKAEAGPTVTVTTIDCDSLTDAEEVDVVPTDTPIEADADNGAFEEAAFVGSVSVTQMDENQEPSVIQVKNVVVDDAIPVALEDSEIAEKSVYSANGTEGTDDSLCVEEGGDTSDNKSLQVPLYQGGCPRRLRLYVFSIIIIALIAGAILALLFGMGLVGSSGRASSSLRATIAPTASPTSTVIVEAEPDPTKSPTVSPTAAPTADTLLDALKVVSDDRLDDVTSPQYQAFEWMKREDPFIEEPDIDQPRTYQRYALLTMHMAMTGDVPSYASDDECTWPTVTCGTTNVDSLAKADEWQVTVLNMARMSLTKSIPPEIGLLSSSLVHLDLAENPNLTGSIPVEVYKLTRLKNLYLHNNDMTGIYI